MNDTTNGKVTLSPAAVIRQYIALRRKVEQLKEEAEKAAKPFEEGQKALGAWLMAYLGEAGLASLKSEFGTAYTATRTSTKVVDRDAFVDFVANGHWEFAVVAADRGQTETYMEEHKGELPPGVEVSRIKTIHVRAA